MTATLFFIASRRAEKNLAPKPSRNFPYDVCYGYHFDDQKEVLRKIPDKIEATALQVYFW